MHYIDLLTFSGLQPIMWKTLYGMNRQYWKIYIVTYTWFSCSLSEILYLLVLRPKMAQAMQLSAVFIVILFLPPPPPSSSSLRSQGWENTMLLHIYRAHLWWAQKNPFSRVWLKSALRPIYPAVCTCITSGILWRLTPRLRSNFRFTVSTQVLLGNPPSLNLAVYLHKMNTQAAALLLQIRWEWWA